MEDIRLLFVGDDWAEDHHDVEVQDETGRRLAKARLPEGISGIARLHAMVGRFLPEDGDAAEVKIGIETDRGPWVAALVASGYQVYAINPLQSLVPARATVSREPRATPVTLMSWPTWSVPIATSCARLLGTARRPARSRSVSYTHL